MGVQISNNASSKLAVGVNNTDTSIQLLTGTGSRFPTPTTEDYFYATLINSSNQLEIVKCTDRAGDILTVVRGQDGTTARAYSTNDTLELRVVAAAFADIQAKIEDTLTIAELKTNTASPSTSGTWSHSGNINLTGVGAKITADFSNASVAFRSAFQSSVTNGATYHTLLPNGTATNTGVSLFNSSTPGTNYSFGIIDFNSSAFDLHSSRSGSGTLLPFRFFVGGVERLNIGTDGLVNLTSGRLNFPSSANLSTNPNVLDDYRELTWAPVVGTSTGSVAANSGAYTKVGNTVFFNIDITLNTGSFSLGDSITLPYSASRMGSAVLFASSDIAIPDGSSAQAQTIVPFLIAPATAHGVLQQGTLGSGTWRLKGSGFYFTNQ